MQRIGLVLLLLTGKAAAADSAALKDIRVWASPDSTRVVLDLSAPTAYTVFSLSNPERVVIDFERIDANREDFPRCPAVRGVVKVSASRRAGTLGTSRRARREREGRDEVIPVRRPTRPTATRLSYVDLGHNLASLPAEAAPPVPVEGGGRRRANATS
jgi:hypothetical protein